MSVYRTIGPLVSIYSDHINSIYSSSGNDGRLNKDLILIIILYVNAP